MSERPVLGGGVVHPWHLDIYGHMNVRHYAPFFDDASFHIYAAMGFPAERMLAEHGVHVVTGRAETNFLHELRAGDLFLIDGAVRRLGGRSVTFRLRMVHRLTGVVHATCDVTEVFFDPQTRKSAPMPEAVRAAYARHLDSDPAVPEG